MAFQPQSPTVEDIEHRFGYHAPRDGDIVAKHSTIRAVMENTAKAVRLMVPPGREQSLAITALEEAMMWSNAGIARNQDYFPAVVQDGPAPGLV